jgi:hypothetical protein
MVVMVMVVVAVRIMFVIYRLHIDDTGERRAHAASALWRLLSAVRCLLSGLSAFWRLLSAVSRPTLHYL